MQPLNKVLKVSGLSFIFVVVFFFVGFSVVLKYIVHDQTALRKRNIMRKAYLKLPIPFQFRAYFFNITNPEEVQQGKIPILREVGPYCYDAWKEKIDVVDNEGDDSLSYTPYETYFFDQEKSGKLSQDDYVTILHPLVVGIINTVAQNMNSLLSVVNTATKLIFDNPKSIYFTVKVRDFLFEGIDINCKSSKPASIAVCSQIRLQVPDLVEVEKNFYKFSIFGSRNGTLPSRFKVLRGIKKSVELGSVVELNHQKNTGVWSSQRCNRFKGTDTWIYPPFLKKENGFWIHTADVCRNFHFQYVKDFNYRGIPSQRYATSLGDMSKNIDEKCFCPSPKTCLPKGIMDLNKCLGVPIYATLPHFYKVDKAVRKKVKGLTPSAEKHALAITMEPLLAVPVVAEKRIQFNLPIQSISKIDFMKNISSLIHPLFWFEEILYLDGYLFTLVKSVIVLLKVLDIVKYCLLGLSGLGVLFGGFLQWKQHNQGKITPAHTISVSSAASNNTIDSTVSKELMGSRISTAKLIDDDINGNIDMENEEKAKPFSSSTPISNPEFSSTSIEKNKY